MMRLRRAPKITHGYTSKRAGRNLAGRPVLAASCPCGWEHMTAFADSELSETNANNYLRSRYDLEHEQEGDRAE